MQAEHVLIRDGVVVDESASALEAEDESAGATPWWTPTALPDWTQSNEADDGSAAVDARESEVAELERAAFDRIEVADQRLADAEEMLAASQTEVERIIGDARETATQLIADAETRSDALRDEAARMRDAAESEIAESRRLADEAGRAAGYDVGFAEGREAGQSAAEESAREGISIISNLAAQAAVDRHELLRNAEDEVTHLAVEIARRVLNRELLVKPNSIRAVAEAALRHVASRGAIRLRVNPDDIGPLSDYWSEAHASSDGDRSYEFVSDGDIERGGVIIETRAGTVDAQLSTQIDEIARDLLESEPTLARGE